jgi:hypothetical protein
MDERLQTPDETGVERAERPATPPRPSQAEGADTPLDDPQVSRAPRPSQAEGER